MIKVEDKEEPPKSILIWDCGGMQVVGGGNHFYRAIGNDKDKLFERILQLMMK